MNSKLSIFNLLLKSTEIEYLFILLTFTISPYISFFAKAFVFCTSIFSANSSILACIFWANFSCFLKQYVIKSTSVQLSLHILQLDQIEKQLTTSGPGCCLTFACRWVVMHWGWATSLPPILDVEGWPNRGALLVRTAFTFNRQLLFAHTLLCRIIEHLIRPGAVVVVDSWTLEETVCAVAALLKEDTVSHRQPLFVDALS